MLGRGGFPTFPAGGGAIPPAGAAGRVLYDDGTNWVALAAGLAGQILTAHGAAAPSWENAPFATLVASHDGIDTYLLGRAVPLANTTGAQLRLYANGGGKFWISFNASFDGTNWTKDYASSAAALYEFSHLGDSATMTQVDDPGVTTWEVWATYSSTDSEGVTRNDAAIMVQFGSEYLTSSGGYIGGHVNFPKTFNIPPSTFTFNVFGASRVTGDINAVYATQYGVNWYAQLIAGAGDAFVFGSVTVY